MDVWKRMCHVHGFTVGCASSNWQGCSTQFGQTTCFLFVKLITNTAIKKKWVIDGASSYVRMNKLLAWCMEREDMFGNDSPQELPLDFSVYKHDILAVEIMMEAEPF